RLRIGHTLLTHRYLITKEDPPTVLPAVSNSPSRTSSQNAEITNKNVWKPLGHPLIRNPQPGTNRNLKTIYFSKKIYLIQRNITCILYKCM
ncbi:hypothetical protein FWK35_00020691, partial [Aphis craccivora]